MTNDGGESSSVESQTASVSWTQDRQTNCGTDSAIRSRTGMEAVKRDNAAHTVNAQKHATGRNGSMTVRRNRNALTEPSWCSNRCPVHMHVLYPLAVAGVESVRVSATECKGACAHTRTLQRAAAPQHMIKTNHGSPGPPRDRRQSMRHAYADVIHRRLLEHGS